MNPIRVFLSIFAVGILLAVILGVVGLNQDPLDEIAEENNGDEANEEDVVDLADAPDALDGCLACHGENLEGASGPDLFDMGLSEEEIVDILENGVGSMPAQDHLSAEEMDEIAEYLVELEEEGVGQEAAGDKADEDAA